ncbi:MAG: hypothetical protein EORIYHIE_001534, partial [Candidatus Fervidibacter sp.]
FQVVYGKMVVVTSRQPVATHATTGLSEEAITHLAAMGKGQPAQALCPLTRGKGFCANSFTLGMFRHLFSEI